MDPVSEAGNDRMLETLILAAQRLDLFGGVRRLLVGCSAGGDSTVLLDLLQRLAPRFSLELAVAHLHHGWRGEAADADADHVRSLAEERRLPCFVERAEISRSEGSIEAAGRRARLAFFERTLVGWPGHAVCLGHSLDDQAETVLLNLTRGAGPRGLAGMCARTRVGGLLILRPLLSMRRAELREYARARGLEWREDTSNADLSLRRNRVRLRLLPELEAIHPGAVENIARAATLLREEEDWLDREVEEALSRLELPEEFPGGMSLDLEALSHLPRALQRRLLRRALRAVRGHRRGLSRDHIEAVLEAVMAGAEAARDLPGVRVQRVGPRLRLLPLAGRRLDVSVSEVGSEAGEPDDGEAAMPKGD